MKIILISKNIQTKQICIKFPPSTQLQYKLLLTMETQHFLLWWPYLKDIFTYVATLVNVFLNLKYYQLYLPKYISIPAPLIGGTTLFYYINTYFFFSQCVMNPGIFNVFILISVGMVNILYQVLCILLFPWDKFLERNPLDWKITPTAKS